MLFANDIILIKKLQNYVKCKLKMWREALESNGFCLSKNKTEYMECKFNKWQINNNLEMKIEKHIITKVSNFQYLRLIIQNNGKIDKDVMHRIQAR